MPRWDQELTAERLRSVVHYDPDTGHFTWLVRQGSKRAGLYKTKEEAARVYDQKAKEVFGAFALLNFPEPA